MDIIAKLQLAAGCYLAKKLQPVTLFEKYKNNISITVPNHILREENIYVPFSVNPKDLKVLLNKKCERDFELLGAKYVDYCKCQVPNEFARILREKLNIKQ